MKRYIKTIIVAIGLGVAMVVACNKKLDVIDKNSPNSESYFKTAAEL